MSIRSLLSLILGLQLAQGLSSSGKNLNLIENLTLSTSRNFPTYEADAAEGTVSTDYTQSLDMVTADATLLPRREEHTAWWCNETYVMMAAAGVGGIFLISLVLCVTSCCLLRRRRLYAAGIHSGADTGLVGVELETLMQNGAPPPSDFMGEELPAPIDVCDVENCTPQEAPHLASELPPEFTPPENLPEPL